MATPTYLLSINGTQINGLASPNGYTVERNKLWSNAGRNLAGGLRATFVGVFIKIKLQFTNLTQANISTVTALLDLPSFSVTFWDPKTQTYQTGVYYSSDYSNSLFYNISSGYYDPFTVDLIPYEKANF